MIELRLLGVPKLRDPRRSAERDALLTQQKRMAVLAYLAAARSGGFHRRESLLGLFWPDLDEEHARGALNQAIRYLRRRVGETAIVSRGQEEVGLNPDHVWCDVAAFEQALEAGRLEAALDLYRGDFLTGCFVSGAPEFDRWLEAQRRHFRERAAAAAGALATREKAARNLTAGIRWARRAMELAPFHEGAVCEAMQILDEAGDRAGAILEYEKFARRLGTELDLEPAPETSALADAIRARSEPNGEALRTPATAGLETRAREGPPLATDDSVSTAAALEAHAARRRSRASAVAASVALLAAVAGGLAFGLRHGVDLEPRRAVVMPFANRTGDASLEPLTHVAADWITQGLVWVEGVQVVPAPHAIQVLARSVEEGAAGAGSNRVRRLAEATGSGMVVTGSFHRHGEELEFQAQLLDPQTGELLHGLGTARAPVADPLGAIDLLRRRTMGALAVRLGAHSAELDRLLPPPTYEAYQLFVEGMDLKRRGSRREAIDRFIAAAEVDSTFVTPLFVAAIEHMNLSEFARADSLRRAIAGSRARLSPVDRRLLRWLEAQLTADFDLALEVVRELTEISPIFGAQIAYDALRANRPRQAIDAYRRMDLDAMPLPARFSASKRLSDGYHRLAEHRRELREASRARRRHPDFLAPLLWEMRALAAMGRTEEIQRRIDAVLVAPPEVHLTAGEAIRKAADELRVHGYPQDARAVLAQALAWYAGRPPDEARTERHRSAYAAALLRSDRPEDAEAVLRGLMAEFPDNPRHLASYGVLLARRGDRAAAEQVDRELARMERPFDFGLFPFLRARIAARLGDRERVIALLAQAVADGLDLGNLAPTPNAAAWAPHLDPAFDATRTDPGFHRLLRPKP